MSAIIHLKDLTFSYNKGKENQVDAIKHTLFVLGHFLILRFFKMQLYLSRLSVQNILLFHISAPPTLRQFNAVQAKNDFAAVTVVISRHGKPCIVGLYI